MEENNSNATNQPLPQGSVSGRLGKKKHKWDGDNCVKCGLIRKQRALSKNLKGYYGIYLYDYKISGEWVASCPTCH